MARKVFMALVYQFAHRPPEKSMQPMNRRHALGTLTAGALASVWPARAAAQAPAMRSWPLKGAQRPGLHDGAPAPDGGVWFTAQASGHLGYFNPATGSSETIALGRG